MDAEIEHLGEIRLLERRFGRERRCRHPALIGALPLNRGTVVVLGEAHGETPLHGNRASRRTSMDTQPRTALEIEVIASSTPFAALHADDRSERSPTPETPVRAITRWLVELALCSLAAAALYGGMCPDPSMFDRD